MANKDHVIRIKRRVRDWNRWRQENPNILPDLSGADLHDANFGGADLHDADLRGTILHHTEFLGADLRGANLSGTSLVQTLLLGANLSGADLHGADLHGSKSLRNANCSGADLHGANLSGADLQRINLSSANLSNANLSGADLHGANLSGADLRSANFHRADLRGADLCDAILNSTLLNNGLLNDTDFSGTDLSERDFSGMDLRGVNLSNADLRQTKLIDSLLDGANLTGAKLWETQRSGWSIKGVICQRAFWDRDGKEPTEYEDGAFERIFAEKLRIVLRYAGGMSPVDLAMLPLIVERLQAEHPDSALHISSVQDDGSGATVTITVEDLAGRSGEAFAQDVEALRGDLVMVQQRLQQEERLRLQAEASYRTMVQDVLPQLLERALPKIENNTVQITGPTTIEGTVMSQKTFNVHGQAGVVGDNAHAHDMTFQQVWNQSSIDLPRLASELKRLRAAMKEAEGKDEQDEAIGAVAAAEKAADRNDGPTALQHLKTAGQWTLGVAQQIGVPVAIEALKQAFKPTT